MALDWTAYKQLVRTRLESHSTPSANGSEGKQGLHGSASDAAANSCDDQAPPQADRKTSRSSALEYTGVRIIFMGGSRGIGRAIATSFAEQGGSLAICARHEKALQLLSRELAEYGNTVHTETCDVSNASEVERFISAAADALNGVDVLVNCASALAIGEGEESWSESIAVDLMGTVRATRAVVPFLKQSRHRAVVNISSVAALQATELRPAYGAIKAAVVHYTASAAKALAPKGIRVNCILPGSTEFAGGIWDQVKTEAPHLYQATLEHLPFGRFATPAEIADAVLFLASPKADWITGQHLVVDGGQTLNGF